MHILKFNVNEENTHLIAIDNEGRIFDIITLAGVTKALELKINPGSSVVKAEIIANEGKIIIVLITSKGVLGVYSILESKELAVHDFKAPVTSGDINQITSSLIKVALISKKDVI